MTAILSSTKTCFASTVSLHEECRCFRYLQYHPFHIIAIRRKRYYYNCPLNTRISTFLHDHHDSVPFQCCVAKTIQCCAKVTIQCCVTVTV